MNEKQTLREFQQHLAERLQSVAHAPLPSKLGFQAGGQLWLVDLTAISELVNVVEILPVPWSMPWFLGLANVRGTLYGCTDLAAFAGLDRDGVAGGGPLLLVHPRFGINAALRVERVLGLHNPRQMTHEPSSENTPSWIRSYWHDAAGQTWSELDIERLITDSRFLEVAQGAWGPRAATLKGSVLEEQPGQGVVFPV